jgi:putative transcriptional regulator
MKTKTNIKARAGSLLIAPPRMPDKRFTESVHLLTHYGKENAFALCLNTLTSLHVTNVSSGLGIDTKAKIPLYWGGPIEPTSIWMVHDSEWACKGTTKFNNMWSLSSSSEMIYEIANNNTPKYFRVFCGYCAWNKDQLDREISGKPPYNKNHSWLIAENPGIDWLFKTAIDSLWYDSTVLCAEQTVKHWI